MHGNAFRKYNGFLDRSVVGKNNVDNKHYSSHMIFVGFTIVLWINDHDVVVVCVIVR